VIVGCRVMVVVVVVDTTRDACVDRSFLGAADRNMSSSCDVV
jgi:hypothetical protein